MLALGRRAGKEVTCLLTDMDQPLGRAVGNALEIREALDTVRGEGANDFTELVLDACARLLAYSDLGIDGRGPAARRGSRRGRNPFDDLQRWIRAQGGYPIRAGAPEAPVRPRGRGAADGVVRRLGALAVGVAALELGAGRRTKSDPIDHAVGVVCFASVGIRCSQGDDLAEVHARDSLGRSRRRGGARRVHDCRRRTGDPGHRPRGHLVAVPGRRFARPVDPRGRTAD